MKEHQKLGSLVNFLRSHKDSEETGKQQAIVFAATRNRADKLASNLKGEGFKVSAIHGDLTQKERDHVMNRFRQGADSVLVATDIAARGIDVPAVGQVINYDVPREPETYFHRIGRTARAGADGKATSFVTPDRFGEFERILRLTKLTINRTNEEMGIEVPAYQRGGNRSNGSGRHRYSHRQGQEGRSRHYGNRNRDGHPSSQPYGEKRREWKNR
jgi:ATP-dependent RNA helicase DeaD